MLVSNIYISAGKDKQKLEYDQKIAAFIIFWDYLQVQFANHLSPNILFITYQIMYEYNHRHPSGKVHDDHENL